MRIDRIRKIGRARSQTCRDILRLARLDDLLSQAGAVMMRASPKATLWTAGIAVSGRLASYLGLPGFTRIEALLAPVVVGGGLLALGAAMRYVPRALSGRLATIAEANDLNLMEDYRKSEAHDHLNVLWDRVFRHEATIRYSPAEQQAERDAICSARQRVEQTVRRWDPSLRKTLGIESDRDVADVVAAVMSERPLGNNLEKSREGFVASALYALRHSRPQSSEAYDIGFHLNLYEDFCDGAYFDPSDTKIPEQYAGNVSLTAIKREAKFGRIDSLRQVPRLALSKFWFFLITREMAMEAGRAVLLLNSKYGTEAFNSQVLLWPGEEDAEWLAAFAGARADVLAFRKSIFSTVLGRDYSNAACMLERAFLPCFEFATELRIRYDPEYCDGTLDYPNDAGRDVADSLVGDLQALGYGEKEVVRAQAHADRIKREQTAFVEYLSARPRGLSEEILSDGPALRAAKIAFHIDKNGLKKTFQATDVPGREALIDRQIEQAVAQKAPCSERLVALRLHHQLTLLQLDGYKTLARRLAYEPDSKAPTCGPQGPFSAPQGTSQPA